MKSRKTQMRATARADSVTGAAKDLRTKRTVSENANPSNGHRKMRKPKISRWWVLTHDACKFLKSVVAVVVMIFLVQNIDPTQNGSSNVASLSLMPPNMPSNSTQAQPMLPSMQLLMLLALILEKSLQFRGARTTRARPEGKRACVKMPIPFHG